MISRSPWLRRYLIFGGLLCVVHVILIFALFAFGLGVADAAPTPANRHAVDVFDTLILVLIQPFSPLGAGRAGIYLMFALNTITWGLGPVACWHVLSAIVARMNPNGR
jgi:hypothetical protein